MLAMLIRLLYPYKAVRRVLRGPLRGIQFQVMPGMGATFALGVDVFHWGRLAERVEPGKVVWDVGANCGQMAMFFSRLVGANGSVISFEPAPNNAAVLRANLKRNKLINVEVQEVALAATAGEAAFVFDSKAHQMGGIAGMSIKLPGYPVSFVVRTETVDGLVERGMAPPHLLKIDVEGGGAGVIEGAAQTLAKHRPEIYFELHAECESGSELMALRRLQEEWGYEVEVLGGDLAGVKGKNWGATVWCRLRTDGVPPAKGLLSSENEI